MSMRAFTCAGIVGLAGCVVGGALLTGCGSPFLHGAAVEDGDATDPGLAGDWLHPAEGSDTLDIRAVITGARPSRVTLTVHDSGEFKTSIEVELRLTDVGGARYADVFLSQRERDRLVERYGFLVLPVHQVLKLSRDGDTLTVWQVRAERTADDRAVVGGGDVALVTKATDGVRAQLAACAEDPGAFSEPIVFRRLTR